MPLDEELATLGGNVSNGILVVMTLLLSQVYRFLSEETIEEGIYTIAQEKLKLERDLAASGEAADEAGGAGDVTKTRRDLKKLLKIALNVDMSEKALGDVDKVYTEL